MWRTLPLLLALSVPARAQPADCVQRPVGPSYRMDAFIGLSGQPGVPKGTEGGVRIDLGGASASMACPAAPPEDDDVLAGVPAPHGLLQGNGPRDVLTNRPAARVTVQPR